MAAFRISHLVLAALLAGSSAALASERSQCLDLIHYQPGSDDPAVRYGHKFDVATFVRDPNDPSMRALVGFLAPPTDMAAAIAVCRTAVQASPGDADALLALASLYLVADRKEEAKPLLQQAADAGSTDAMASLSSLVDDAAERRRLIRKAAEAGNVLAMFLYGADLYLAENATPADKDAAIEWVFKGARKGLPDAITALAFDYALKTPAETSEADKARMVAWIRRSAETGNVMSMLTLGEILIDGSSIAKDPSEGLSWVTKAANADYVRAIEALSLALDKGEIVPRDTAKAAQWVLRGCRINNALAFALNSPESTFYSEDTRRAIQTSLRAAGLYLGATDGRLNEQTQQALRAWGCKLDT